MASDAATPRLVLLDSHGIMFRAYYALGTAPNPLQTSGGEPTFAVYGFAETLLRVLDDLQPTHIAAAWDAGGPTFRHDADERYKATRRETPGDFISQMERTRELLDAFNIPIIELPGYEADDVLGTLGAKAAAEGIDTYLVTLDTDLVQLVRPHLRVYLFRPYQRDMVLYDEESARERWGFDPPRMVDFKALKGDASDNIPGVRGIGEKTATTLIQKYGTVEEILEHLDELPPAQRKKLDEGRDEALHSKRMVEIVTDLDLPFDMSACVVHDFDKNRVLDLFRQLEFRRLAERFEQLDFRPGTPDERKDPAPPAEVHLAANVSDLEAMAGSLRDAGTFSLMALSSAGWSRDGLLLGIAAATADGTCWYVPIGHAAQLGEDDQAEPDDVRAILGPLLADQSISKVVADSKQTLHLLGRSGIGVEGIVFDDLLAGFLLGTVNADLRDVAAECCGERLAPLSDVTGTGRNAVPLVNADRERVAALACAWAGTAHRIREPLTSELQARGQMKLLEEMEIPLARVLYQMERHGIAIDTSVLSRISGEMQERISELEREIYDIVGHEFNIGSPKQLSDVLFGELGLPKTRKTKLGYSTDQRALEPLRELSPVVAALFDWRELTKLKSTYCDALPGTVAADGRIHTDFQQNVAATGRLSSTNPNLQNIPVRTPIGQQIRRAFVASYFDDPIFVAADYSQIELRILADMAGDPGLLSAFHDGADIHRATAAAVYGVGMDEVTRQMRDTAKMVNFGIAYGISDFGLASRSGMSRADAAAFIENYFERFPAIRAWQEEVLEFTRSHGYAESKFGRRRYLPAITASNYQARSAAEREAINMPIQGTAADIMKIAMLRVDEAMRERGVQSRLLLQVHDELIFECPTSEAEMISELACELMEGSAELKVPLKVEVKKGRNWGDLEP